MMVLDKALKVKVDVCDRNCQTKDCYWARPDPGRFTQGKGYSGAKPGYWLCGTREIHGCPQTKEGDK